LAVLALENGPSFSLKRTDSPATSDALLGVAGILLVTLPFQEIPIVSIKRDFLWFTGSPPKDGTIIGQDKHGKTGRVYWTDEAGGWWIDADTHRVGVWPIRWRPCT